MKFLKKIFDFYLNSSIHVACSAFSFVKITQIIFSISTDDAVSYFVFFATIVGYNFVKYDVLVRMRKSPLRLQLKIIALLSFLCLLGTFFFFFQLKLITKWMGFIIFILTLLYTLPFFPNKRNARNWAGIKIYIVSICWVGVTLLLPVVNSGLAFSQEIVFVGLQRFTLIFVLILIFEVIDLKHDDVNLRTVPQQIGVQKTKFIGSLLLIIFVLIECCATNFKWNFFLFKFGIALTTFLFLLFSNKYKSKYYTSFWVESIPIFWWMLVLVFG